MPRSRSDKYIIGGLLMPLLTLLVNWLMGTFGTLIGYQIVRFAAWKVILWTLVVTVLPIILNNFLYGVIENLIGMINDADTSGFTAQLIELTGVFGWVAQKMRIVECFSLFITAVIFRKTLDLIPFIRF